MLGAAVAVAAEEAGSGTRPAVRLRMKNKTPKEAFGKERREGGASSGMDGGDAKDESVNEDLADEERPTTDRPH